MTKVFSDPDWLCPKCGLPLDGLRTNYETWHRCSEHHYDRAFAVGVYEKALLATVLKLKREPHLPRTAKAHLTGLLDRVGYPADVLLVPVPLSRQRQLERGFNQAAVLAKTLSKHTRLPVDERSLVRIRDAPKHRAAMDAKARDMSVADVFAVQRPRLISGRDILLIDDLMTSGATVSHCARVLKKNGAGRVEVLTLARAI